MGARGTGDMGVPSPFFGNNSVISSAARLPHPRPGALSSGPWQSRLPTPRGSRIPHTPVVILRDNLDVVQAVNRSPLQLPPGTAFHLHTGYTRHRLHIPPGPPPPPNPCGLDQGPRTFHGERTGGLFFEVGCTSINVAPIPPAPPPRGGGHQWRLGHHFKNTETPHPLSLPDSPAHSPAFQHQRKFPPAK